MQGVKNYLALLKSMSNAHWPGLYALTRDVGVHVSRQAWKVKPGRHVSNPEPMAAMIASQWSKFRKK